MNYRSIVIYFTSALILCFSSIIVAESINQLDQIKKVAEEYVKSQITVPKEGQLLISAGEIDSRIQISTCFSDINKSIPGKQNLQRRVTVLLECESENWQLYIPVNIKVLTPVLVAKRPLSKGVIINNDDLIKKLVDARFVRGDIFSNKNALIGSRIKRRISMNNPIKNNDICMVCKDDSVVISAQNNRLLIATKGSALSDGSLGEQIKVKNISSNKIIDAKISAVGKVVANF